MDDSDRERERQAERTGFVQLHTDVAVLSNKVDGISEKVSALTLSITKLVLLDERMNRLREDNRCMEARLAVCESGMVHFKSWQRIAAWLSIVVVTLLSGGLSHLFNMQ